MSTSIPAASHATDRSSLESRRTRYSIKAGNAGRNAVAIGCETKRKSDALNHWISRTRVQHGDSVAGHRSLTGGWSTHVPVIRLT